MSGLRRSVVGVAPLHAGRRPGVMDRMTSTPAEIVAKAGEFMAAGHPAEAVATLQPLWDANPGHAKLRDLLSSARLASARRSYAEGDLAAATTDLTAALVIDPDNPRLHGHRAVVLQRSGDPVAAEQAFAAALALAGDPAGPDGWIWIQAAMLDRQAGRMEIARRRIAARRAAATDDPEAEYAAALIDLADGRLTDGWAGYAARWRIPGFPSVPKATARPLWDGQAFPGRLLVWREQGVGDEIMFLRHLEAARRRCGALVLETDPRLVGLLRRSFPEVDVRPSAADLSPSRVSDADFDSHLPIGALPGCLTDDAGYPGAGAYLAPDPARRDAWRQSLRQRLPGDRLVGLSWWSKNAEHGRTRSPDLAAWRSVTSLAGHRFISLQYEANADAAAKHGIVTLPDLDPWQDLDGLAALIAAMDAVVSIDNSTAHLAGALGVPTEVLLPFHVDWRWQMPIVGGGPLYASLRMHRQGKPGAWGPPIDAVAAVLADRD